MCVGDVCTLGFLRDVSVGFVLGVELISVMMGVWFFVIL